MKELEEMMIATVANYFGSGKANEVLEKYIEKTVNECIEQSFRFGKVRNDVKEIIEDKFKIDPSAIDVQDFNAMISEILNAKLQHWADENAEKAFQALIAGFLTTAPKEITLQSFVSQILERLREDNDASEHYGEYYEVDIQQEQAGEFRRVTLKIFNAENVHGYAVNLYFHSYQGEPFTLRINRTMDITNPTCMFGLDSWIFSFYCRGTQFTEIDQFDIDHLDTRMVNADY